MTTLRTFLCLACLSSLVVGQDAERPKSIRHLRFESALLTEFFGRPILMDAGVVLPPDLKPNERLPVCFAIHGFGGTYEKAWSEGARLVEWMATGRYPRLIYVYPDANCPFGHHMFADSVNNGPWGRAFIDELIPQVDAAFPTIKNASARFLTGHSSGGWASLWLQLENPEVFSGVWSTAPDSVDFRDLNGIDLTVNENLYLAPDGKEIPLLRKGGRFVMSVREMVAQGADGMLGSIEAVYSPRGDDGRPQPLFDRKSGAIDRSVADAWSRFDIGARIRADWKTLGPRLEGKLNVFVGAEDDYRLEGAVRLLKADLESLGSDAKIVIVDGRTHADLHREHETHWPRGMLMRIHQEMAAAARRGPRAKE